MKYDIVKKIHGKLKTTAFSHCNDIFSSNTRVCFGGIFVDDLHYNKKAFY